MTLNDLTADERKRVQEAMGWGLLFPGAVISAAGGLIHMTVSVSQSLPLVLVAMLLDIVGIVLSLTMGFRARRRAIAAIEAERTPTRTGATGRAGLTDRPPRQRNTTGPPGHDDVRACGRILRAGHPGRPISEFQAHRRQGTSRSKSPRFPGS